MRHLFFVISVVIILSGAQPAFCDWDYMIMVNRETANMQASRDSDCPWPIAADDSGNVYIVWEDEHTGNLEIYFRKRNYDGTWSSPEKISNEETLNHPHYGHPSICVVPGQYPPKLITCYVREYDGDLPLELRGNTFDGQWGDRSYYISDEDSDPNYVLPLYSHAWGTNIVSLSDGKAYAFWLYDVDSSIKLYFNEYDDGWNEDNEKPAYDEGSPPTHYSYYENACVDPDDNIHLVYFDNKSGQGEIYYLNKGPEDEDFGEFAGYKVSSSPDNVSSAFPYCAISEVADTTFLHVVWSTIPPAFIYYRNWNSVTSCWSAIIDTIAPQVILKNSDKPSVACDLYGNVHVVWEEETEDGYIDVVKYRKFDYAAGEWGSITILPADEEEIDVYGIPVIISDVYDNLHVVMTGERVGGSLTDEEVYYSFYDAPPHISNLAFVRNQSNEDSVVISWTGWGEPDLHTYRVYRKLGAQWELVDSTTATRYADTEVSYSSPCFQQVPTNYYVEAVDNAYQTTSSDTILIWCVEGQGKIYGRSIADIINLQNNYPNPFNAQTTIEYNVPFDMQVTLEIYDILGRKVETLIDDFQPPGSYAVTWDASHIASGMYFYKLQAGEYTAAKRMSIIK